MTRIFDQDLPRNEAKAVNIIRHVSQFVVNSNLAVQKLTHMKVT